MRARLLVAGMWAGVVGVLVLVHMVAGRFPERLYQP
jgi:hypothetical protein